MRRSIRKRLRTREPTKAPSTSPPERLLLRLRGAGKNAPFAASLGVPTTPGFILSGHPTSLESSFLEDSASTRAAPARAARNVDPNASRSCCGAALALGGGLIVLILIVLGVKGCLDARANRALSDYARDVTQIVEETDQTSKAFFGKLDDPGSLSVTDFVDQVNADRSAMDNYASRVDGLDAPGDMGDAQNALELTYELRSSAMNEIADKMSTALGDAGAAKATAVIASQMQKLLASDVLYAPIVRPEIDGVLAANGIDGSDVPESVFLPDETNGSTKSAVSGALGAVSGASGADDAGRPRHSDSPASASTAPNSAKKRRHGRRPKKRAEVEVAGRKPGRIDRERGRRLGLGRRHRTRRADIDTIGAGEIGDRDDPADADAERRSDARSQSRHRSPASRSPKTTKPATRSSSNRRLGAGDEDRLPRPGRNLHRGRARRGGRRRASSSRCARRRSTTRSSPSSAARPSAPWSRSRTRSRARSAAPSTPSPSRPRR